MAPGAADSGQVRADVDGRQAARLLVAATDGLQVQWLLARDSVDMAAILRGHVASLLTAPL